MQKTKALAYNADVVIDGPRLTEPARECRESETGTFTVGPRPPEKWPQQPCPTPWKEKTHSSPTGRVNLYEQRWVNLIERHRLGYLPIDKAGADLLFQVISQRYEQGSILLTTNQPYKHWPKIFNNDSTLTSAVLDRLLHHAETVIIEGKSYRMKDQIETP